MTFLPIVQRELRVAAGRRSTFLVRWWTTLVALALSFVLLGFMQVGRNASGGSSVFTTLSFYAFGLCLLAGVFLTADVLSEEKRQGTLGLLFLTDLKGYDIVLGKFMAQGLNAFYCLLAVLPALALPLLLGGTTAWEFWRTVLALLDMLLFSLAAGLLVSAKGREARKTMGTTFWLLLCCSVALPLLAAAGSKVSPSPIWTSLQWLSPFSAFACATETRYLRHAQLFWGSLLVTTCCSFLFFALASLVIPRVWQEGTNRSLRLSTSVARSQRRGDVGQRARLRSDLLSRNPVVWLASERFGTQWAAWFVVGLWAVVIFMLILLEPASVTTPLLGSYAAPPFGFCLKLVFGLQVGRLFAEYRRSGALELLLCTPLTSREIIRGQMLALVRNFWRPLAAFIGLLFAPLFIQVIASSFRGDWQEMLVAFSGAVMSGLYTLRFGIDLVALTYFGMGLALTLKQPHRAPALTVLFVLVLPSLLSMCLLDLVADIVFIAWGAGKTSQDLRRLLTQENQPVYLPRSSVPVTAAEPG